MIPNAFQTWEGFEMRLLLLSVLLLAPVALATHNYQSGIGGDCAAATSPVYIPSFGDIVVHRGTLFYAFTDAERVRISFYNDLGLRVGTYTGNGAGHSPSTAVIGTICTELAANTPFVRVQNQPGIPIPLQWTYQDGF